MAWVAAVAAGLASAVQSHQKAKQKQEEAQGYQEAGRRRLAAGTREAQEADRKREFMNSRALAVGAASGAGTSGPGFVKVLADLDAEGEYGVLARMWAAQNDAEGLYFRADAARRESKSINSMAMVNALTSATTAYFGAKAGTATAEPSSFSGSRWFEMGSANAELGTGVLDSSVGAAFGNSPYGGGPAMLS